MKEALNKDGELSISSGDPTVANSDSDDESSHPVWIPLKDEIDHNIDEAEEKVIKIKSL